MALFIVRHEHKPDRCPATDPYQGTALLNLLSREHVRRHGVEIKGEAVMQGEHTLYLIVESADQSRVLTLLEPFSAAGSLEIHPASTCARVVASGGCAAADIPIDAATLDPAAACADAIEAGLVVHRVHPLNCETSIPQLIGGVVVPNARFYVRNHFPIPALDATTWRLSRRGPCRTPTAAEPARAAAHAVTDPCGDAGVRGQRPFDAGPARRGRAVAPRRGQYRGVDGSVARRGPRPGGARTEGEHGGAPRGRPWRRAGADRSRALRAQPVAGRRPQFRRPACLRDERRAASPPARLPGAIGRAAVVRGHVRQVADRHRGHRHRVHRLLPIRAVLLRVGARTCNRSSSSHRSKGW
jgi:hypothetical protein